MGCLVVETSEHVLYHTCMKAKDVVRGVSAGMWLAGDCMLCTDEVNSYASVNYNAKGCRCGKDVQGNTVTFSCLGYGRLWSEREYLPLK